MAGKKKTKKKKPEKEKNREKYTRQRIGSKDKTILPRTKFKPQEECLTVELEIKQSGSKMGI